PRSRTSAGRRARPRSSRRRRPARRHPLAGPGDTDRAAARPRVAAAVLEPRRPVPRRAARGRARPARSRRLAASADRIRNRGGRRGRRRRAGRGALPGLARLVRGAGRRLGVDRPQGDRAGAAGRARAGPRDALGRGGPRRTLAVAGTGGRTRAGGGGHRRSGRDGPVSGSGRAMLAAFEGWNDAADASSGAIEHLEREWSAKPFAAIDPEDYYDYQVNRPTVRLVDG